METTTANREEAAGQTSRTLLKSHFIQITQIKTLWLPDDAKFTGFAERRYRVNELAAVAGEC